MKKGRGHLPNLVVIGAPKCGTTSLHYYLNLHPQIRMSRQKELNFFIEELNWKKGTDWYRKQFRGEADVYGESSPLYSNCLQYKNVPGKMCGLIPEARLVYLLRDPIQRILSHYIHAYARGLEERSLQDALRPFDDSNPYMAFSRYSLQLEAFMVYYPLSRILVLTAEELKKNRGQALKTVFGFLGVDDNFISPDFRRLKNTIRDVNYQSRFAQALLKTADSGLFHLVPAAVRARMAGLAFSPFWKRIPDPELDGEVTNKIKMYLRADLRRLRKITQCRFEEWEV